MCIWDGHGDTKEKVGGVESSERRKREVTRRETSFNNSLSLSKAGTASFTSSTLGCSAG